MLMSICPSPVAAVIKAVVNEHHITVAAIGVPGELVFCNFPVNLPHTRQWLGVTPWLEIGYSHEFQCEDGL
jgi:hypothetical protein